MKIAKFPGFEGLDGCEKAPEMVTTEFKKLKLNEKGNELEALDVKIEEVSSKNIFENTTKILESDEKVFFIGGGHSITYSLAKAFFKKYSNGFLMMFDAHPGLMPADNGHDGWLRALIDEGIIKANQVILCGARKFEPEELKYLREKGIKHYTINQMIQDIGEFCEVAMEFTRQRPVYASIDIDAVDPAFAPATAHPETGGLTSRQLLYVAGRLSYLKQLKAVDIVEINPGKSDKHGAEMTVKLGAKLIAEFL